MATSAVFFFFAWERLKSTSQDNLNFCAHLQQSFKMWTQFHVCMEQRPVWVSSAGLDCLMRAQEDREGGHQQQFQVLRTCALVRIRFVQPLLLTTH